MEGGPGSLRGFKLLPGTKRGSGVFLGLVREVKAPLFGLPPKDPPPPPVFSMPGREGRWRKFLFFLLRGKASSSRFQWLGILMILGLTAFVVWLFQGILLRFHG